MRTVNKRDGELVLKAFEVLFVCFLGVFVAGCASKYVSAAVKNQTGGPVTLIEVDYPSASFGKETLAAGAEYDYRFKVLGEGATKVMWTDAGRVQHSAAGPELKEGEQGVLGITLTAGGAAWDARVER
jgi:hypothetical protein